jgi:hypothetical protein
MMRLRVVLLVLLTSCGSALFAAPWTGATVAGKGSAPSWRSVPLTASPAPSDLELFQVSFPHSDGPRAISAGTLTMTVSAPFGDDYLALTTPSSRLTLVPRALVLVVNRPSALLDPVDVRLRLWAAGALGAPLVSRLLDPLTRPGSGTRAALCDLSLHGEATLGSANVRTIASHGDPLSGFGPSGAVSQAYDLACGLPFESAFKQAVRHTSPVGRIPGEGCRPTPGRACPETATNASEARAKASEAGAVGGSQRSRAGAH